MEAIGPIRMKDVDEAQSRIVAGAKAMADAGEIKIAKNRADEELVF
jgi:flagellar motor switch protein FliG